ncbi:response regulator, partial [Candidatus Dependentiae bacterium]|nr:response regulator [Candidatus Dependentiae bacterium]
MALPRLTLENIGSFLEKLAEKSTSVYWLSSPDFKKIQYISPAYEKIWGRSREELYKNPETWITFLHPEDSKNYHPIHAMAERTATLGPEARYDESYRIIRPDGEVRWIIDRGFPIFDQKGNCCGVTGVAIDATKEKEVEKALREAKEKAEAASAAKTAFLENMRHDLRTPLSGVTGFAELMKMKAKDPEMMEYAENLHASAQALLQIHNEILEIIRVTSGGIPHHTKKFNLKAGLENIVHLMQAKAKSKKLALKFYFDEQLPFYFVGDGMRIDRIALELLSNALRFTERGSVNLSVELKKQEGDEILVKLCVQDTGIGIPVEKREDIFSDFTKLIPSHKARYHGLGLGLTILKEFITDLNGEVYVESQPGKGSTFSCMIPLKKSLLQTEEGCEQPELRLPKNDVPRETKSSIAKETEAKGEGIHVLLVEDDPLCGMVAKTMLQGLQCYVDIAETGEKAIQLVKQQSYQLIFMDIGLPDMTGYQVTQALRTHQSCRKIPIIALSAHAATDDYKQECVKSGITAVFSKPLSKITADNILESFVPSYLGNTEKNKLPQEEVALSLKEIKKLPLLDYQLAKKL